MTRKIVSLMGVLFFGLLLLALSCAPAGAVKPADFYKGKNIDFTIATEPGGSVDVMGRLVATYLGKSTGATFVVNNRRGAGGVEGVMWIYRATPDGLTIGTWSSLTLVMNKIDEAPGADYKLEDFNYLMGISREPQAFFVASKGPYQSITALQQAKGKKLGGTSARGNITLGGMSVAHILDLDAKVVTGYKGIEEAVLAMEQGETIGSIFPVSSGIPAFKSGRVKPLFILGTKKFSYWPEVPALSELVNLQGDKKAEVDLWQSMDKTQPFYTTPGVPQDRVKYLQEMGEKVMKDTQFRNDVDKLMGYPVKEYLTGKELTDCIKDIAEKSKNAKALFDSLVKQYGAVR